MARPFFLASLILMLATACAPARGRSDGGGGVGGGAGDGHGGQGGEGVQAGEDAEGADEGERKVGDGVGEGGGEGEGEGADGADEEPPNENTDEGASGAEGEGAGDGGEGHEGNQGEEGGQEGGEDGEDCIDEDGDGYGLGRDCLGRDCNDGDPDVNPEADEICDNGFDDDCDARFDGADDECAQDCVDGDGDRYGQGPGCIGPDCNDFDPLVNPGIREACGDDTDNDCDGDVDEECGADGDGLACWQFVQCTGDCEADDRACRQRCVQAVSEDGAEFYTDLVECIEDECPDPEDGQCPLAECGTEYGECLLDNDAPLDCGLLELCYRTCPQEDQACVAGCEEASARNARDQLQAVYVCIERNCDPESPDFQECYQARCARELETCFGPPPQ